MRSIVLALSAIAVLLWSGTAQTQIRERGTSGNYMLPLCEGWLRLMSNDVTAAKDEITSDEASREGLPVHLMNIGMCVGEVWGTFQALRTVHPPMACVPPEVTKLQVVGVVVAWLEQHAADLQENFTSLAGSAIIAAWPCNK
jgi:hypothetical protein